MTEDWAQAACHGAYLVYRGEHYRTLVTQDRAYSLAVRLTDEVGLDRFEPSDIAATSGDLPGPPWVALHPASVERTYVRSATARWSGGPKVWLASAPDLDARTVLVGSFEPFPDSILKGRQSIGRHVTGWFTRAPLDELADLRVTEEPYQLS